MKNVISYKIVENVFQHPDSGTYTSYGIYTLLEDGSKQEILDITTSAEEIAQLERLISENDLHPIHLKDVVEDFIAR